MPISKVTMPISISSNVGLQILTLQIVILDIISQDPVTNNVIDYNYVTIDVVTVNPVSDEVLIQGSRSDAFIQDSIEVLLKDLDNGTSDSVAVTNDAVPDSDDIKGHQTPGADDDFYYDSSRKFKIIRLEKSDIHNGKTKMHNRILLIKLPKYCSDRFSESIIHYH